MRIIIKQSCDMCGACINICPYSAIHKGSLSYHIDEYDCLTCGICVDFCKCIEREE